MSDPTPSEERAATNSLGELVGEVTRDLSTLMRQEVALAKAELKESAVTSAKGAGMLGGAGYAALMGVLFLSLALWATLTPLVGWAWSGLIVAVIWLIIAAVLFVVGRTRLKKVKGAPQTVESLQEIPQTLRRNEENR
ncbi:phage holin family protein [Microbacterium horticulturae]|uniref:Phage holin family protein n=1 Tax=Microbacterium horticulturae TaxID=3028316 RepID=A0ABY8C6S6_9MICO|nr:phage holin family protein [Microbacterium sp. KACC 23027]WEG10543.1 phage holin family protein [Microbacterium sp. KACC 23027]